MLFFGVSFTFLLFYFSPTQAVKAPTRGVYISETEQESEPFITSRGASPKTENPPKRSLKSIISEYGWDTQVAYAVMKAESGGNPSAVNWNDVHKGCIGSFGLFQLGCMHGAREDLLNAEKNVEIAYKLWRRDGWSPWTVCGKYVNCF